MRLIALLLSFLLLTSSAYAQGAKIAYVLMGGVADNDTANGGNGITDFMEWAKDTAPRLEDHGYTRVFLQNPGGVFDIVRIGDGADTRVMRVDQWILAERTNCSYADRDEFRGAVELLRSHGIVEVICYVGSPTQLDDPRKELPQVLEAFTDCGSIVSIGFDAMVADVDWEEKWAPNSKYRHAVAALRQNHRVYCEARMTQDHIDFGLGSIVDGTIAEANYDENPVYEVDMEIQPGEKIRLTEPVTEAEWDIAPWWPETAAWDVDITRMHRSDFNWGPLMPPPL